MDWTLKSTAERLALLADRAQIRALSTEDRAGLFAENAKDPNWPEDRDEYGKPLPRSEILLVRVVKLLKDIKQNTKPL